MHTHLSTTQFFLETFTTVKLIGQLTDYERVAYSEPYKYIKWSILRKELTAFSR